MGAAVFLRQELVVCACENGVLREVCACGAGGVRGCVWRGRVFVCWYVCVCDMSMRCVRAAELVCGVWDTERLCRGE